VTLALAKQPATTYLAGMSGSVRVAGYGDDLGRCATSHAVGTRTPSGDAAGGDVIEMADAADEALVFADATLHPTGTMSHVAGQTSAEATVAALKTKGL
jgi:hypothetical protein